VLAGGVIEQLGVITQVGAYMRITFGESVGRISARGERFLAACQRVEFDATLSTDIAAPLWIKFIGLIAMSGATALSRQPMSFLREDPDGWEFVVDLIREMEAICLAAS
jgi:2-dehydropantoate 2-reductase